MAYEKVYGPDFFENESDYGMYFSRKQTEQSKEQFSEMSKVPIGEKIFIGRKKKKDGDAYQLWNMYANVKPTFAPTYPAPVSNGTTLTEDDIPF